MQETTSNSTVETLIVDLLEWLGSRERTYEEVMDAWRTSCPRWTVWEDANERGLVASVQQNGRQVILPTPAGLALVQSRRQSASR